MAISVDIGTFVVGVFGLLVTFNPQVLRVVRWVYLKVRGWIRPADLVCESFTWQNFRGPLHLHRFSNNPTQCDLCRQVSLHADSRDCYSKSIALAFNNVWASPGSKSHVKKPEQLPLNEKYLRIEARTALAYFFTTARIHEFREEMLSNSLQYIDLSEKNGVVVAHLGRAGKFVDLSREEVERILDGWPAFYREYFISNEGHRLRSPLRTFDDARRPGWVVAIGLGRVQPTDVFIDNSKDEASSLFTFALQRVQHVLDVEIERSWPQNQELDRARRAVRNMRKYGRSIEHEWLELEDRGPRTVAYPEQHNVDPLSQAQCEALMQVFQNMSVGAQERAVIDPDFETCLRRVVVSVVVALGYRAERRRAMIPSELQGDQFIYLRGCSRRSNL